MEFNLEEWKKTVSEINELRIKFWSAYRDKRNEFLSKYPRSKYGDDPDWQAVYLSFENMRENTFQEELRRELKVYPQPPRPIVWEPVDEELISNAKPILDNAHQDRQGLYSNDRLCVVCGLPLKGRQQKYCSEACLIKGKVRQSRKKNPRNKAKIARTNKKYWAEKVRKISLDEKEDTNQ